MNGHSFGGDLKIKEFVGDYKVRKGYVGDLLVYTSASEVTYHVDTNNATMIEVDEGESILNPSITPTKSGYTFIGWRYDTQATNGILGVAKATGEPIDLYAVFSKAITVTTYNNSTAKTTLVGYQLYNNGNINNPKFTLTQKSRSTWVGRGWTTSNKNGASAIVYTNGQTVSLDKNITLYGCYQRNVTISYNGNGATSGGTSSQNAIAYYHSVSGATNAAFYLRSNSFVKAGWTFRTWAINSPSGQEYKNGSYYETTTDTTFYALYMPSQIVVYTATYSYANGFTELYRDKEYFSGTPNITEGKAGYYVGDGTFDGSDTFTLDSSFYQHAIIEVKYADGGGYADAYWAKGSFDGREVADSQIFKTTTGLHTLRAWGRLYDRDSSCYARIGVTKITLTP